MGPRAARPGRHGAGLRSGATRSCSIPRTSTAGARSRIPAQSHFRRGPPWHGRTRNSSASSRSSRPILTFRPPDAATGGLDNEDDDLNSDGLQVYLQPGGNSARVPAGAIHHGAALRARPVPGDRGGGRRRAGRWRKTEDGYTVSLAVRHGWDLVAGEPIGFQLIVNEMHRRPAAPVGAAGLDGRRTAGCTCGGIAKTLRASALLTLHEMLIPGFSSTGSKRPEALYGLTAEEAQAAGLPLRMARAPAAGCGTTPAGSTSTSSWGWGRWRWATPTRR